MIFALLSAFLKTKKAPIKEKKKQTKPTKLILSWKIILTVLVLTRLLFEHFASDEGEMKISLLKTMKENVCLERQDGDTWCLVWEGDLWWAKSARVGLPCWHC